MEKHVTIVAALHIGSGILCALVGCFTFLILAGSGFMSGDLEAIAITSGIGTAVAILFLIFSVPSIIGGVGLLKRQAWARILVLIISALNLLNFPIGTAIGIYSIWVLVQDDVAKLFKETPGVAQQTAT